MGELKDWIVTYEKDNGYVGKHIVKQKVTDFEVRESFSTARPKWNILSVEAVAGDELEDDFVESVKTTRKIVQLMPYPSRDALYNVLLLCDDGTVLDYNLVKGVFKRVLAPESVPQD